MRVGIVAAATCGLVLAASTAGAYDSLEADFATCTQGSGKVDNATVVTACTRLIDNAKTENELVGLFYAMRATANDDKAANCSDAHKVLSLTDDPNVIEGAKKLVELNC
jgi:hypothetical protein